MTRRGALPTTNWQAAHSPQLTAPGRTLCTVLLLHPDTRQLMTETRALASRSEDTYRAQLKEKGKQLEIMQALLDDAQRASMVTS